MHPKYHRLLQVMTGARVHGIVVPNGALPLDTLESIFTDFAVKVPSGVEVAMFRLINIFEIICSPDVPTRCRFLFEIPVGGLATICCFILLFSAARAFILPGGHEKWLQAGMSFVLVSPAGFVLRLFFELIDTLFWK
jgi:hypothetical protein